MRMLMNNVDPEIAEHPDQLIVYGGGGKAARSWAAFDAIVASLRVLENDETLLVQSGKPVGIFRTHEWAPRVLIANANLVPEWANWPEFRRLDAPGADHVRPDDRGILDLHRDPGHPAGHLRDLCGYRRQAFRGDAGRHHHPHRRARRHGRRPADGGDHERGGGDLCRDRPLAHPAPPGDRLPRHRRDSVDDALDRALEAKRNRTPLSIAVLGNAADVVPELLASGAEIDVVTDQTSAHDPLMYVPGGATVEEMAELRLTDPVALTTALGSRWRPTWTPCRLPRPRCRGLRLRQLDPRRGPAGRLHPRLRLPRLRSRLYPPALLRGQGSVPLGRPLRRPGRHRGHRPGGARRVPRQRSAGALDPAWPARRSSSRACPPASAGSVTGSATVLAFGSTRWCARRPQGADRHRQGSPRQPARSPRRTARPRRCATAPTPSPTGRS